MLLGGWELDASINASFFGTHVEASGAGEEGGSAWLALPFHGVGALGVKVENVAAAGSVALWLGDHRLLNLEPGEQCHFVVAHEPGDRLRMALVGRAAARLSEVRVLSYACPAQAVGAAATLACWPGQLLRLSWTHCLEPGEAREAAPAPLGRSTALPWVEGRLERAINSTHGAVRVLPAPAHRSREVPLFDPASPLVSYGDAGTCGPRGDDAQADTSSCGKGAEVVAQMPNDDYKPSVTVRGCGYYAYTVYRCVTAKMSSTSLTLPAWKASPVSQTSESAASLRAAAAAPRCESLEAGGGAKLGLLIVANPLFQNTYKSQIASLRCFAARHKYDLWILEGPEYSVCSEYHADFFFKKHCMVAEFLERSPSGYVAAVLDADVVAAVLDRGLEQWLDEGADVQLYQRCQFVELAAGNYMVRNTAFARGFLRRWASYCHQRPPGYSSSDNGAIHLVVAETVMLEGTDRCRELYRGLDLPVTNLSKYWNFVRCVVDTLGPARAWHLPGGRITIWPRLQFWVTDASPLDGHASLEVGPVMHHGVKDKARVLQHYYKDLDSCELKGGPLRDSAQALGARALSVARARSDIFPQGTACPQCAERCMHNFSCRPLDHAAPPVPRRTCGACGEAAAATPRL